MAQTTAVNWVLGFIEPSLTSEQKHFFSKVIEQAKEMEKQQIITAMIYTFNQQNTLPYGMEYMLNRDGMLEDCEDYYNETYNIQIQKNNHNGLEPDSHTTE